MISKILLPDLQIWDDTRLRLSFYFSPVFIVKPSQEHDGEWRQDVLS